MRNLYWQINCMGDYDRESGYVIAVENIKPACKMVDMTGRIDVKKKQMIENSSKYFHEKKVWKSSKKYQYWLSLFHRRIET